eukprot:13203316-Alexandrium_andersonii.AAC.1
MLADVAGPVVEPLLSSFQTAVRVGDCSRNITTVFRHLGQHPDERWRPLPEEPPEIWCADFEEAAHDLWELVRGVD